MKFSDFKVATRLGLSFGVVLLLSIASAGLALNKLSSIEDNVESIVTDFNVKIKINNELAESVHIVSRAMRSLVILEDKALKEQEATNITHAREAYAARWEALQKLPASDAVKANRASIQQIADTARVLNTKVVELGMANKTAEAVALLLKEAGPATQKWQDAIDKNIAAQEANNQKQFELAQAQYVGARNLLIGANFLCIAMAVLVGWLVTRSIRSQLGAEPGEAADLARSVAAGDLSVRIALKSGDDTSLMAQLKVMQDSLVGVVSNVRQGSESVAIASAQIAQGNQDLSQRTEEQASALEETAASMEQLSSTVKQNADNAKQANQLAQGASSVAIKGGEVVGQVVDTMKEINDSSKRIADIISVIDGIAFQTNILALNAAVEAARAGEQGRGFAVVASEVRNLAGRSAEAAKEIKSLITASVERVEQGTALVDQAGVTMTEVVSSIKRVTDIMGEISAASIEQSAGVSQVGEAIGQMDQVTQQNAALVEESAAAAESLKGQAQQLVQTVAVFKLAQGTKAATSVPTATASAPGGIERRGPDRAKNVTRPAFGKAKAAVAKTAATTPSEPAPAAARTGTNDWESF
jgi:methyl-accepting chemotaxis protein